MAIKRYIASADTTITNAFRENLITRGTGSNSGANDTLEVFSIYGQQSSGSAELSRILIQFEVTGNINDIAYTRHTDQIPSSGSVNFYLRMFNSRHEKTLPKNYTLEVIPVTRAWNEGDGLDIESYTDLTFDRGGANWMRSTDSTSWSTPGGDYLEQATWRKNVTFNDGTEDLELDVTDVVENWIKGASGGGIANYGFGVRLVQANEAYFSSSVFAGSPPDTPPTFSGSVLHNLSGSVRSYYTKKFFSRSSEFFFKKPILEARWDSSKRDDRSKFYLSSSLATQEDNLNTVFLYNYSRGKLANIRDVGKGAIFVTIFSGNMANNLPTTSSIKLPQGGGVTASAAGYPTYVTGGWYQTGIYTASFALTGNINKLSKVYDVWSNTAERTQPNYMQFFTGTIILNSQEGQAWNTDTDYVSNITNIKSTYSKDETARFRIYARPRNWNPAIYNKATSKPESTTFDKAVYKIIRTVDDYEAVSFGTGSDLQTRMSYDVSGNYFDFDMRLLEPGYMYEIKLAYYLNNSWKQQRESFKFKVE